MTPICVVMVGLGYKVGKNQIWEVGKLACHFPPMIPNCVVIGWSSRRVAVPCDEALQWLSVSLTGRCRSREKKPRSASRSDALFYKGVPVRHHRNLPSSVSAARCNLVFLFRIRWASSNTIRSQVNPQRAFKVFTNVLVSVHVKNTVWKIAC